MPDELKTVTNYDTEALIEALRKAKDASDLTNADIEAESGIPESTIAKLLGGRTPNPTFETVARTAYALDVSLDTLSKAAIQPETLPEISTPDNPLTTTLSRQLVRSYEREIQRGQERERKLERRNTIKDIIIVVALAGLLFYLLWDITHPTEGMIQYGTAYVPGYFSEAVDRLKDLFTI